MYNDKFLNKFLVRLSKKIWDTALSFVQVLDLDSKAQYASHNRRSRSTLTNKNIQWLVNPLKVIGTLWLTSEVTISNGSANSMFTEHPKIKIYVKMGSAAFDTLSESNPKRCLTLLNRFQEEGNDFLDRTVECDKGRAIIIPQKNVAQ